MAKFENYLLKEYGMTNEKIDKLNKKIKEILCYVIKSG